MMRFAYPAPAGFSLASGDLPKKIKPYVARIWLTDDKPAAAEMLANQVVAPSGNEIRQAIISLIKSGHSLSTNSYRMSGSAYNQAAYLEFNRPCFEVPRSCYYPTELAQRTYATELMQILQTSRHNGPVLIKGCFREVPENYTQHALGFDIWLLTYDPRRYKINTKMAHTRSQVTQRITNNYRTIPDYVEKLQKLVLADELKRLFHFEYTLADSNKLNIEYLDSLPDLIKLAYRLRKRRECDKIMRNFCKDLRDILPDVLRITHKKAFGYEPAIKALEKYYTKMRCKPELAAINNWREKRA